MVKTGSNIAVLTGSKNNLTVLDIDPRNGAMESLRRLIETYGPLPKTLEVTTGGNGRHLYFSGITATRHPLPGFPGIDVQSEAGYVVAPPSVHLSGKSYQWVDQDCPIAELPEFLKDLSNEPAKPTGGFASNAKTTARSLDLELVMAGIPAGQRHDQLFRYAAHLKRIGVTREEALLLVEAAARRSLPPYTEESCEALVAQAWKYDNVSPVTAVLEYVLSEDCDLSLSHRAAALSLASYVNEDDVAFPAQRTLAEHWRVSQPTVSRLLEGICGEGKPFMKKGSAPKYLSTVYQLNRRALKGKGVKEKRSKGAEAREVMVSR